MENPLHTSIRENDVMQKMLLLVLMLIFSFPMLSCAASFDCAKAVSSTEKLICSNESISKLDEQLANSYKQALEVADDKGAFKKIQIQWVNQQRACKDLECLKIFYQVRINQLKEVSNEATPPKPISNISTDKNGEYVWMKDILNGYGDAIQKPREPNLCQDFLKNLKSFSSAYPMVCQIKINPELKGFKGINWKPLNVNQYEHLIRDIYLYTHPKGFPRVGDLRDDQNWKAVFDQFKSYLRLEYENIDVNHDGTFETVVKIYKSDMDVTACENRLKSNQDVMGNRSYFLADSSLEKLVPLTSDAIVKQIFFTNLDGDIFIYKGDVYLVNSYIKGGSLKTNKPITELSLEELRIKGTDTMTGDEVCRYWFMWPQP
jgi:uncharacterized protein